MKRSFAKIVLLAAILVMVLGCASVFAAEEGTVISEIGADDSGLHLTEDASLTAVNINYSTSEKSAPSGMTAPGGSDFSICPIKVTGTGKLYVDVEAVSGSGITIVVGKVTGDQIDYTGTITGYLNAGDKKFGIGFLDVKAGNTYYLGIKSSGASSIKATAYVIPYGTRTLKAGKTMIASGYKNSYEDSVARFKIKATKTGYIVVGLSEPGYDYSTGYVTLLNSKKKTVSGKIYFSNGSYPSNVFFGVKKGATYYLKVNSCQGTSDYQYAYGIKWKNYSATYKSNKSKKKALTLKRKAKAKKIARPATGKSMTQWYKIKVSKRKAVFVVNTAKMTADSPKGKTKIAVYRGKKKVGSTSVYPNINYTGTISNARKGTYYIKVTNTAKCNGMYTIRFKS